MHNFEDMSGGSAARGGGGITPEELRAGESVGDVEGLSGAPPASFSVAEGEAGAAIASDAPQPTAAAPPMWNRHTMWLAGLLPRPLLPRNRWWLAQPWQTPRWRPLAVTHRPPPSGC